MKHLSEHVTFACNMPHFISIPLLLSCLLSLLLAGTGVVFASDAQEPKRPHVIFPKTALVAQDLGVVVNDNDPLSVEIGSYYQQARKIPAENMIHIRFDPDSSSLSTEQFQVLKTQVDTMTPVHIQAYALTWASPYRVGCMSITSAFTFGFDQAYCASGCKTTKNSPYFNSASHLPFTELGLRPTMAIAASNFEMAKQLIDRGVQSDFSHPQGKGYLLSTSDKARNTRAALFPKTLEQLQHLYPLEQVDADFIAGKQEILFYFTGKLQVPALETNRFLPGAIADHLTSAGGKLTDSSQMSSLRWLEAGATGSYGAVVEPCNFVQKFPHPGIVMARYLAGESLLEAYWKSVVQPGQGIFIGEPLATPFGGIAYKWEQNDLLLQTRALLPGAYLLVAAETPQGPFTPVQGFVIEKMGLQQIRLKRLQQPLYRILPIQAPAPAPATQAADAGPQDTDNSPFKP